MVRNGILKREERKILKKRRKKKDMRMKMIVVWIEKRKLGGMNMDRIVKGDEEMEIFEGIEWRIKIDEEIIEMEKNELEEGKMSREIEGKVEKVEKGRKIGVEVG